MFKKFDIILFKEQKVILVGIIVSLDFINENLYEIITLENFQYKQLISKNNIIKKIGRNENFLFINNKSNHLFNLFNEEKILISNSLLKEYWEFSNHDYGKLFNQFKNNFLKKYQIKINEIVKVKIISYEGPYLYTILINNKNLIIPEKILIKGTKI